MDEEPPEEEKGLPQPISQETLDAHSLHHYNITQERTQDLIDDLRITSLAPTTLKETVDAHTVSNMDHLQTMFGQKLAKSDMEDEFKLRPDPIMRLRSVVGMHPRYCSQSIQFIPNA